MPQFTYLVIDIMRPITIVYIKSYNFELELIDKTISALILPCLDYKAKTTLPRHETRPGLEPPRPRQDQDIDPRDQDQGQGT